HARRADRVSLPAPAHRCWCLADGRRVDEVAASRDHDDPCRAVGVASLIDRSGPAVESPGVAEHGMDVVALGWTARREDGRASFAALDDRVEHARNADAFEDNAASQVEEVHHVPHRLGEPYARSHHASSGRSFGTTWVIASVRRMYS